MCTVHHDEITVQTRCNYSTVGNLNVLYQLIINYDTGILRFARESIGTKNLVVRVFPSI